MREEKKCMKLKKDKENLQLSLEKYIKEHKNTKEANEELKIDIVSAFNENEESKKNLKQLLVKNNVK